jgi:hypothetical protein
MPAAFTALAIQYVRYLSCVLSPHTATHFVTSDTWRCFTVTGNDRLKMRFGHMHTYDYVCWQQQLPLL